MLILAAMVWLPPKWVGAIGVAIIVLHHLFDRVQADSLGPFKYAWMILHQPGVFPIRPPDIDRASIVTRPGRMPADRAADAL